MIPTTDPSKMLRDAEPLVARLEKATGRKVTLTIPQNYAAVVEALVQGQVDVAHFGGFTFVQASKRAGAIPLVQRDRDREFHSKFITARDTNGPREGALELVGVTIGHPVGEAREVCESVIPGGQCRSDRRGSVGDLVEELA